MFETNIFQFLDETIKLGTDYSMQELIENFYKNNSKPFSFKKKFKDAFSKWRREKKYFLNYSDREPYFFLISDYE